MRKLALSLAATLMAAGPFVAPAMAQDVRIRAGDSGVTIRTDDDSRMDRRRYDRRYGEERRWYGEERRWRRHRDRDVYAAGSVGCRNVMVRSERPNGDVVVRKMRRCD